MTKKATKKTQNRTSKGKGKGEKIARKLGVMGKGKGATGALDPKTTGKITTLPNGETRYPPYVKIRHDQVTHERIGRAASKAGKSVTQFCTDAVATAIKGTR